MPGDNELWCPTSADRQQGPGLALMWEAHDAWPQPSWLRLGIDRDGQGSMTEETLPSCALLVGCNEYKNIKPRLNYCQNDVIMIGEILKKYKYHVEIWTDSGETEILLHPQYIRHEFTKKLQTLAKRYRQIVIYFSGHGCMKNGKLELLFNDHMLTDHYSSDTFFVYDIVAEQRSAFEKTALFIDSCHAGTAVGEVAAREAKRKPALEDVRKALATQPMHAIFAAANASERAFEYAGLQMGLFSYCVYQGLSGAAAEISQDKCSVSVQSLSAYITKAMNEKISDQYLYLYQCPKVTIEGNWSLIKDIRTFTGFPSWLEDITTERAIQLGTALKNISASEETNIGSMAKLLTGLKTEPDRLGQVLSKIMPKIRELSGSDQEKIQHILAELSSELSATPANHLKGPK